MRILLIMDPFIPVPPENYGGIERIVFDVASEYVKKGHSVTLVAGPNSRSPGRLIVYGKNGPLNPNINFRYLAQVYAIIRKEINDHDVIHNFGRLAYLTPFLKTEIPKVQSYLRFVSRFNIRKTNLFNPVNLSYTAVSDAIKETGIIKGTRWQTVYNCAPVDQFCFKKDTRPDSYLTFIGRFERCKGLHHAIQVAQLTNRQLIIAGFISTIPKEIKYFQNEIRPFIDGHQIKWIGEINNVQRNELLRNASALLTPVEWLEPFPVIIPEAYACGTPVLGFNRGGVPEGIEHGVTGYISETASEMASDVLRIDQLSRRACRDKAEKEYSAEKIAGDYFKLYTDIRQAPSPRQPKLLLIMDPGIPVPPPLYGGHERLVSSFAEAYRREGYHVTLLAGPGSFVLDQTVTFGVNDLERTRFQKFKEIMYVWSFLRVHQFDVVHNFGRLAYLLPVLNNGAKKIMTYGRKVTQSGIRMVNCLPNRNLVFTACSDSCVQTGNIAGRWKTVYNAIDFSAYSLNELPDRQDAPLMFLGRLDRIKGVHTAIQVAKATGNILFIGGNISPTRNEEKYFKEEIKPLIDNVQIKYLGPLNDAEKNAYLGNAKALLFPIEWEEPFGMVMIEAMACGTPVVAFRRGSVPEVIDQNITGMIVNNAEEMVAAVSQITSLDRVCCRERAAQRFDINVIAKDYLAL